MKKSTKVLLAGAAMAGLMTGYAARSQAFQTAQTTSDTTQIAADSGFGLLADSDDKGKHDCKGKNDCKGKGGCKTDKNACKGHNDCKGQGGCSTKG